MVRKSVHMKIKMIVQELIFKLYAYETYRSCDNMLCIIILHVTSREPLKTHHYLANIKGGRFFSAHPIVEVLIRE